jgi:crotonobetainyl-CoA:carnitine CoA-transferase CaiB-like acyl-CoA transferase
MGGPSPVSSHQRSLGGAGFYQVYRTSDGKHVVLGGREIKFAENLLGALGRPDLIAHASREAGDQQELIAYLQGVFATKSRDQWADWFADKDVAFAPVLNFREALDEPHIAERGLWIEHDGAHHIAPAIRFASETWHPAPAPELNSDG